MKKRIVTLSLVVALAATAIIGGTMAYFTSEDEVTNTFTVGDVSITLDEAEVDEYGENPNGRTDKGNEYKLVPGHKYIKDPTVTVVDGSEECYVRMLVKVENYDKLTSAITDSSYYGTDGTFLLQNLVNGTWDGDVWEFEKFDSVTSTYEFRYSTKVEDPKTLEPLFEEIVVPSSLDKDAIDKLGEVNIVVTAHAIQADTFADADAAWAAWTN